MHTFFEVHRHKNQKLPFYFHKNMTRAGSSNDIYGWHPAVEICRCVSGKGQIVCNSVSYPLKEGDIFIVNSNALHKYVSEEKVIFGCLIIDESFFTEVDIDLKNLYFEPAIRDEEINRRMILVGESFESTRDYRVARIRSHVLNLLLYLCDRYAKPRTAFDSGTATAVETTKLAIGYINAHLTEKLTLEILAKETGLSKYHLCHEFKKITKHTMFAYINISRCEKAARLLLDQEKTIHEVGQACGFENDSYFTRTFVKYYGMTPSGYRRENR